MIESCPICKTPYVHSSRVNAQVPTCFCLKEESEKKAKAEKVAEHETFTEQRVLALRLGSLTKYDKLAPDVEGWSNPKENILKGENLLVMGPVGTNKTTILKQVAYHAALAGLKVRGGYVLEMLSTLKDMDKVKSYSAWLESGHVLILDDLDKLLGTQYEVERLMLLIDRYWAFGRSIVVSMNMSVGELERKIGTARGQDLKKEAEAIISRLLAKAQVKQLTGKDMRAL